MNKGWFKKGHIGYWKNKIKVPKTYLKCGICKENFIIKPYRKLVAHYCSSECYGKSKIKGDKYTYVGLHTWVRKKLGSPKKCEMCGLKDKNRYYDWANKSGKYKQNLKDWLRLCRPCHRKYDK